MKILLIAILFALIGIGLSFYYFVPRMVSQIQGKRMGSGYTAYHVTCFHNGKELLKSLTIGKVKVLAGGTWSFLTTDGYNIIVMGDCSAIEVKD